MAKDLPVHLAGSIPLWNPETWDFRVFGLVESPLTLSHAEFEAIPRVERISDLHDVSTWSVLDNRWEGVPAREIVARVRPLPQAAFVLLHADGGASASLPLSDLLRVDVLLATRRGGVVLPPEQGAPLRIVVPHRYAFKSLRWLRAIEVLDREQKGFFEARGYSASADPWKDDRFAES
jgi:DMSO/TMAO reductase YedYZ molybdopterin-dependent catalytic subunit